MLQKNPDERPKASELLLLNLFQPEAMLGSEDSNIDQPTSASPLNNPIKPKGIIGISPKSKK